MHCQPPGRFTPDLSPFTSVLRVKALPMAELGLMASSNQGGVARGACLAVLVQLRAEVGSGGGLHPILVLWFWGLKSNGDQN